MALPPAIDRIRAAMAPVPGVAALFVSGSHATGHADAYSDLDFLLVSEDGASDTMATAWREAVAELGEIVLLWDRNVRPVLINAIVEDWTRVDVVILRPDQIGHHTQDALIPLIDPGNLHATLNATAPDRPMSPAALRYRVEEFLRILGLLHLAIGREEYLNGVLGLFHLRRLLIELMVEETGAPHRGGALHLNRLTTVTQRETLMSLPAPVPEREALIAAHLAYAGAFLPLARKMGEAADMEWPTRFEAAVWTKLEADLGVSRPN